MKRWPKKIVVSQHGSEFWVSAHSELRPGFQRVYFQRVYVLVETPKKRKRRKETP